MSDEMLMKDRLFAALMDHSGYALLEGELDALMGVFDEEASSLRAKVARLREIAADALVAWESGHREAEAQDALRAAIALKPAPRLLSPPFKPHELVDAMQDRVHKEPAPKCAEPALYTTSDGRSVCTRHANEWDGASVHNDSWAIAKPDPERKCDGEPAPKCGTCNGGGLVGRAPSGPSPDPADDEREPCPTCYPAPKCGSCDHGWISSTEGAKRCPKCEPAPKCGTCGGSGVRIFQPPRATAAPGVMVCSDPCPDCGGAS